MEIHFSFSWRIFYFIQTNSHLDFQRSLKNCALLKLLNRKMYWFIRHKQIPISILLFIILSPTRNSSTSTSPPRASSLSLPPSPLHLIYLLSFSLPCLHIMYSFLRLCIYFSVEDPSRTYLLPLLLVCVSSVRCNGFFLPQLPRWFLTHFPLPLHRFSRPGQSSGAYRSHDIVRFKRVNHLRRTCGDFHLVVVVLHSVDLEKVFDDLNFLFAAWAAVGTVAPVIRGNFAESPLSFQRQLVIIYWSSFTWQEWGSEKVP